MTNGNTNPVTAPGQGTAGLTDVVVKLAAIVSQLSSGNQDMMTLINTLSAIFPRVVGTFTLAAAATTTVTQPGVKANSIILWTPTDASAGTLMGSAKALYLSSISAGTSFTVATASGGNAVGTETFSYGVFNPA